MCDHDAKQAFSMHFGKAAFTPEAPRPGSRRRRLWELPDNCHCPVVGVCMPMTALRKLVDKALGGSTVADDYELHVGAVRECASRNRISEILQKELDLRHAVVVQRLRGAKSSAELLAYWEQASAQGEVTGAFWAALTHPRCDSGLQERLCRDIHMIQHQAGAGARADLNRLASLQHENGVLARELGRAQERATRLLAEKSAEIERLRAELVVKEGGIAGLRADLEELQEFVPELEAKQRLQEKVAQLQERQTAQEAQIAMLRQQLEAARAPLDSPAPAAPAAPALAEAASEVQLQDKTVLCVGGRGGSVASYRGIVEKLGGRYLHHDGGLEESINRLDASIAAADVVICQTGCISHSAYWRVKDTCKRSGKRCIFVDNPSPSSLTRSLTDQFRVVMMRDASHDGRV